MTAQYANQESDDTLHDKSITISSKHELAILIIALQPYTALTAIDEVLFILIFLIKRLQLVTQVDEHLILIHPIGEVLEFLYYFILQIIDCSHYFISLIMLSIFILSNSSVIVLGSNISANFCPFGFRP